MTKYVRRPPSSVLWLYGVARFWADFPYKTFFRKNQNSRANIFLKKSGRETVGGYMRRGGEGSLGTNQTDERYSRPQVLQALTGLRRRAVKRRRSGRL